MKKLDVKRAAESLARLSLLKFFPADPTARTEIVALVCHMAATNEQVDWLVTRTLALWNEWEGPRELRAVYCSKFKPADGIEAYSVLPRFADDGIPSENPDSLQLASGAVLRLEAPPDERLMAEEITASPTLQRTIAAMALSKDLERVGMQKPKVPEVPVNPPTRAPITEADIRAELARQRDAKAREEAGLVAK